MRADARGDPAPEQRNQVAGITLAWPQSPCLPLEAYRKLFPDDTEPFPAEDGASPDL